jgi:hypothetical protein
MQAFYIQAPATFHMADRTLTHENGNKSPCLNYEKILSIRALYELAGRK